MILENAILKCAWVHLSNTFNLINSSQGVLVLMSTYPVMYISLKLC